MTNKIKPTKAKTTVTRLARVMAIIFVSLDMVMLSLTANKSRLKIAYLWGLLTF
jgi:hypothetical protein